MPVMDTFARVAEGTTQSFRGRNAAEAAPRGVQSLFKPWASALIGLAVVFTLWGFSHRFNEYHFRNDVTSRSLTVKISSEDRKTLQASLETALAKTQAESSSVILAVVTVAPSPIRWTRLDEPAVEAQELAPGASRAPGRAPPSLLFSSLA